MCIYHILLIQSSVGRHLHGSHLLAVGNVAVNFPGYTSVGVPVFSSLGCIPRNGIIGYVVILFLKNHQIVLHTEPTLSLSRQWCVCEGWICPRGYSIGKVGERFSYFFSLF